MDRVIKLHKLIGDEGRSRVNVQKLNLDKYPMSETLILDFENVRFISRSFTDEILTLLVGRAYSIVNANDVISNMFKAVVEGRGKSRSHAVDNSKIKKIESMVELSKYLNMCL